MTPSWMPPSPAAGPTDGPFSGPSVGQFSGLASGPSGLPAPPAALAGLPGAPVHAVDTPALVVDLDAMDHNLERLRRFAHQHSVRWRPHAKMHKCAEIALLQMQAGASGVCVQKTAEAEALAERGVSDIFISNEVVAPRKLARVAALAQRLAQRHGRLALAVDSLEGVLALADALDGLPAAAVDVFIELDVGQGRCGVAPGPAAVSLAQAIALAQAARPGPGPAPRLRLAGLHAYHGGAQHLRSPQARREAIAAAAHHVTVTRGLLEAAGFAVPLVTGAGTGTFALEAASGVWDEIQPGSFLFMDADYARNGRDPVQPAFEHALFVKSQVMSVAARHAVCDAGHKSHALDSGGPLIQALPGQPALVFANGGDEHGILAPATPGGRLPALGETVWLIPGHCDPTVNLHDWMIGVRGGLAHGKVERLLRVDARGALS